MVEKELHADTNQKKAGVVILVCDRADFRAREVRDKEGCYIMEKKSVFQEEQQSVMCVNLTRKCQNI